MEAALRYPTNGEKALERIIVGGVLVVLSVFVLPAFFVFGDLVRSLAAVVFTFGLALFVLVPLGAFIDFWVYLVTVHLFGVAYREAVGGAVETSATPA